MQPACAVAATQRNDADQARLIAARAHRIRHPYCGVLTTPQGECGFRGAKTDRRTPRRSHPSTYAVHSAKSVTCSDRPANPRILPAMRRRRRQRHASAPEAPVVFHLAARCHVRLSHSDSHTRVRRTVRLRAAASCPARVDNRSTRLGDAPRTAAPSARPRGRGRLAPLPFNMLSPSRALHRAEKNVRRARRRTPQSACLRKNAGMSYVSTPFS